MIRFLQILLFALLACWRVGIPAQADLVGIEYYDRGSANPQTNGGPLWTGEVNTSDGTLRFTSWKELPGHGSEEFWVPQFQADSPMVWQALDSGGNPYTLPTTFGSVVGEGVTIGNDFAFFSPMPATQMAWADISGNAMSLGHIYAPTRIGWGGYAEITTAGGDWIYHTSAVRAETPYNETTIPRLPVGPNNMFASLDATIRVTYRTVTEPEPQPGGDLAAIPEAGVATRFCVLAAGGLLAVWVKRSRAGRRSLQAAA
ncbi:hypothetical protein Pla175_31410 [Pirellulimonas nuda]|uniref:PEP-CTERM protein-sorting domain-containing protein n=1 Tax=Pirellulimonas nuda TaxID=2528009 RepID=A0A518DE52_9BACT|nr:hypothetical protein [Pirellulimonas nuda]QDU89746.1 hypothetical protein Pla175_31410 [Pirellulimonas nuda]